MTKEAGRTTVSGPLGDCIVIERGEYLVRAGPRTVRSFEDEATAMAYAKAYVGIVPKPVTVIKEVPVVVKPDPKTVDTRATLNKKVESRR